jgi:hypothetical protein
VSERTLTRADKARRLGIALVVIVCVIGLGFAVGSTREIDADGDPIAESGDPCDIGFSGDVDDLPTCDPSPTPIGEIVERYFPPRDSEALQQVQVGLDLGPRYDAVLVVDGIEVPDRETVRVDGVNQVLFSPGDGLTVEEWAPGRNCVRAIVWPIVEGRDGDGTRNVDWCFEVT